jgi:hypothetical protein
MFGSWFSLSGHMVIWLCYSVNLCSLARGGVICYVSYFKKEGVFLGSY